MTLNTAFLLMAQYGNTAIIPPEDAPGLLFTDLTVEKMLRKVGSGELALPVVRIERSQKSARALICKTWWTTSISDARRRLRSVL